MDIIRNKKQHVKDYREHFSENEKYDISQTDELKCQIYRFGQSFDVDDGVIHASRENVADENLDALEDRDAENSFAPSHDIYKNFNENISIETLKNDIRIVDNNKYSKKINFSKWMVLAPTMLCLFVLGGWYIQKGLETKKQVLGTSKTAYANVNVALDSIKKQDFASSSDNFNKAYANFADISKSLEGMGRGVISISRFIPGASKLSSGYYAVEAGKELSLAGEKISQIAKTMDTLKNKSANENEKKDISLLEIFLSFEKDLKEVEKNLTSAQNNISKVKLSDIPQENREELLALKNKLPIVVQAVEEFSTNSYVVADLLGANGPRKYLFLFQNNQEMRATGGFIGSYGVLDIDGSGKIRNFFIDGIFNPDGQLLDKVVPPKPIQKISVAWSLHDSNWFADFPTSAKKAMLFYEKTGGPTVDGVITVTPTVMQKLLNITGPIEMRDYGVVLTSDNFIENIQYEVEEDYDKEENKPKKILSDLAPIVLDKIFNSKDTKVPMEAFGVFEEALEEKHVLLYFSNADLQKIISDLSWSGEILETSKDYLSVINTNINGYKTDGVVEEKINHQVTISDNGEIINTVAITRKHHGGNKQYEWYNKVNANYMRVYVPQGSTLLEVDGQTREINEDVVDYKSLNFEEDIDVKNEEAQIKIDESTGTRVYNEAGKTVFANWVYVSPQEEVTIRYKYILPFKIDRAKETGSYSVLEQKQSGSLGDEFNFSLSYPNEWKEEWKSDLLVECHQDNNQKSNVCFTGDLKTDKFIGVVFGKN